MINKIIKLSVCFIAIILATACSSKKHAPINNNDTIKNNIQQSTTSNVVSEKIVQHEDKITSDLNKLKQINTIYFDFNKYYISSNFKKLLDDHATFLCKNTSYSIIIEGHADERGTAEYNLSLGEHRANAIKMYLQSKGVSSKQMTVISYGKEKPVVLGHDDASYAKNRRAVLVY